MPLSNKIANLSTRSVKARRNCGFNSLMLVVGFETSKLQESATQRKPIMDSKAVVGVAELGEKLIAVIPKAEVECFRSIAELEVVEALKMLYSSRSSEKVGVATKLNLLSLPLSAQLIK